MRIALAQVAPVPIDVAANLAIAERTIALASEGGAQLVAFPELSLTGYELDGIARTPSAWLHTDDPRLDGLRRTCTTRKLAAVLGAPWRDAAQEPRLAAIIITAAGELIISRKRYLHGREPELFVAARPAPPFEVSGWSVSIAICFDAANPPHAADAAALGTDLYIGSALYTPAEDRRCDLHFGARAMDHRMFSALANYAGSTGGMTSLGRSGIWRPTGDALCRTADNAETLLYADLDRAELDAFRATPRAVG